MFRKVLIANRGEIALRVIRACHALNIPTVAVYSEADAGARHVQAADEAVLLGPPPAPASYLNIPALLAAARDTGAEAVHPGYGFLAENAGFARACQEAGLTFIGPEPDVIRRMGDKVEARQTMQAADVPVVPGLLTYLPDDPAELQAVAAQIGYPLMIKAAAGGGGIGMLRVAAPEKLGQAFDQARRRAQQAFANPALYLERAIDTPRHIEVQLLGDKHGHLTHVFERECSVQRRHQKVIEESPSPFVDDRMREGLLAAAERAGQAVGYSSAGTVEFIADRDHNFYFLEMNTRIQVEHPVTEMVTGVDLVQAQIRVAAGEALGAEWRSLRQRGHAIEARVYAEDPVTMFPSPGTITDYDEPSGDEVRIEGWVTGGTVVTPFYDPLLAKVVVWDETRPQAIQKLRDTLARYRIEGIKTNIPLLQKVLDHPGFVAGQYDVTLLSKPL